jgi:hypothetical protein
MRNIVLTYILCKILYLLNKVNLSHLQLCENVVIFQQRCAKQFYTRHMCKWTYDILALGELQIKFIQKSLLYTNGCIN